MRLKHFYSCVYIFITGGKEFKGEEKGENENSKFEVRLLRDPTDASAAHWSSSREETGAPGEDTQDQTKTDNEKWVEGGGHSREEVDKPEESLPPSNQQESKEAKIHHSEESRGEEREEGEGKNYPKGEHREDAGEEKYLEAQGEKQSTFSNKRSDTMGKKKEESWSRADTHSVGLHEKTHSQEQGSQESGEEARRQEKQPQELSNHDQSEEESEEVEEDGTSEVTKRRPRHHHGRSRPNKSSQEGHPVLEERRHGPEESEEADVTTASLGERRGHHPTHYRPSEEEPEYGEETRSYPGFQVPDGLRGTQYRGRGSEEDRAARPQSEESQERQYQRSHINSELESVANRHGEETEERRGYEGTKGGQYRGRGGEPGAYSAPDTREEKRFLGEGHYPVHHEGPIDKAKRYPQSKWQEEENTYLNYGEDGDQGKWWQQEELLDPEESREEVRFPDRQYAPYPTAEKRKRLGVLLNPYFDPLQWKNSDFEKKDNPDDSFREGEDGNGLTLADKNFFPEYNYEWWEKRPFSEDVNWGYEKRSFARGPHLDFKRQYDDGVAELDQLLHYRKKSAEFPDFYDSEEQAGPHQEAEDAKGRADQRILTEEEVQYEAFA